MCTLQELIPKLPPIVQAAQGEIIGDTRFQKLCYLMEQTGMGYGLRFRYENHGPYSEELDEAIRATVGHGLARREVKTPRGLFNVYTSPLSLDLKSPYLGSLPWIKAERYLRGIKDESSIVLELAASLHWFKEQKKLENWRSELEWRKGKQLTNDRYRRSVSVLNLLDLCPLEL